jgi:ParB-like chromosome segregation protein Spo0J
MDGLTVMALVKKLRTSLEDWDPVLVRREGDHWLLLDGRHRFFAAVIAGRPDVLAVIEIE